MYASNRRRMLLAGATMMTVGITGCLGSGDSDDDDEDGVVDTRNDVQDDDHTTAQEDDESAATGRTIRLTEQTGRYEYEIVSNGGIHPDTIVWDVEAVDGDEASVVVSTVRNGSVDERFELTVTAATIEDELIPLHQIDYIHDILFPFEVLGDVDVDTLSVGTSWEGGPGEEFEVTDTDSHAGIDCFVVERRVVDALESKWCVSSEHAMVLRGATFDPPTGDVRWDIVLVSYDPES